jgi:type IV pilus assembly protein PilB
MSTPTPPNDKKPPQPGTPNPNAPKPVVKAAQPQPGQAPPKPAQPQPGQAPRPATPQAQQPAKPTAPGAPAAKPPAPGQPAAKLPQPQAKDLTVAGPALSANAGANAGAKPAPKPAAPGMPGAKPPVPGAKPGTPAATGVKPAPKPATPPVKKAAPAKNKFSHVDSNTRQLGQKLVDLGHLDDAQLESVYEELRTSEMKLAELVVQRGLVNEDQMLDATAELHGMKVQNLEDLKPSKDALTKVPQNMAELYRVVPVSFEGNTLTVALSDPNNLQGLDDIRNFLGITNIVPMLGSPKQVEELFDRAYRGGSGSASSDAPMEQSVADIIKELEADPEMKKSSKRETSIDFDDIKEMANAAPVRKLVNMVMLMAIRDHASDVHFEPFEEEYKMRYKCDGVLYEMVPPPRHLATAIASRIKVMANLDIAERRLPQDGRIELNVGGNRIDMRVSVLPTMFGESTVIRVLDQSNVGLSLDRIGMPPRILSQFRQVIKKPNGICLVTGPTGSGKTTTLYSALSELNDIETKIITTEDPVEYEIDGIVQCPINSDIDFTFASALRAILRQDPDVILIGEIRDLETAQIAIQASLTGHLVFSTLHTNDAPSSITRLRDMGVEPFLITATVEAIQAQRLVRKVCQACKTAYDPTREQLMELNITPESFGTGKKFYYGEGCDKCNNLGFKGRTGLYELLIMNDDIRDMVSRGASTDQVRNYCRDTGTESLRDSGLAALLAGTSTLEEIVRETVVDD